MTRITNADIPGVPAFDTRTILSPWLWHGSATPDGAVAPFYSAPLGSIYFRITAGTVFMYVKTTDLKATTDWAVLAHAGATVTGDLIVTGTVTAGDIVIST